VRRARFYREVLDRMIEERILEKMARRLGIDVKDEEVDQVIEKLKKAHGVTDEVFRRELGKQGFTVEGYRSYLKTQIRKRRIIEAIIKPKISPDEKALKEYYEKNKERFARSTQVRLSHIFISLPAKATPQQEKMAKTKMAKVIVSLKEGKDFSEVALLYSEESTAKRGGDMGYIKLEDVDPALREVIEGMEVGDVSGVVRSPKGLHLFKLTDRREGGVIPFEQARGKVIGEYYRKEIERLYGKWLEDLKRRFSIEVRL